MSSTPPPASKPPAEPASKAAADADAGDPLQSRVQLGIGLAMPLAVLVYEMWRVRQFTVDDSYISFRYSRNLARGLGLVYNEGERVEGYTNFLWTVMIAGGIKLGIDPVTFVKTVGGSCAALSLYLLWLLGNRLRPYTSVPSMATWLFATSILNTGYPIFGLETGLFVTLILAGLYFFFREEPIFGGPVEALAATGSDPADANNRWAWARKVPWSGLFYGLAGITRPEAPMYIGILVLFLGRGMFTKRNVLRGILFVAPVGAHLLFRHSYYGQWTPNTFGAKTGNLAGQWAGGVMYIRNYIHHEGPILVLAVIAIVWAILAKRRDLLAITATGLLVGLYVAVVGGDWMPLFRFLVPFEPFCFLLIDFAIREGWDRLKGWDPGSGRSKLLMAAVVAAGMALGFYRTTELQKSQRYLLRNEDRFWKMAAGGTAKWLLEHPRGTIALGDIGYVGYATDYPLLDLLGLVDPVIAKLPGGYTQKIGPGFTNRLFEVNPRYALIISSKLDCRHPSVPGSVVELRDPRFLQRYSLAGKVPLDGEFAWCIYENPLGK